jgi:hypothetical protein
VNTTPSQLDEQLTSIRARPTSSFAFVSVVDNSPSSFNMLHNSTSSTYTVLYCLLWHRSSHLSIESQNIVQQLQLPIVHFLRSLLNELNELNPFTIRPIFPIISSPPRDTDRGIHFITDPRNNHTVRYMIQNTNPWNLFIQPPQFFVSSSSIGNRHSCLRAYVCAYSNLLLGSQKLIVGILRYASGN